MTGLDRSKGFRGREWLLVATSALFTSGGLAMAVAGGRSRRGGIGVAAFFGLCLGIAIWTLVARRAHRRGLEAIHVEIVGSVPIPVRRGRPIALLLLVAGVLGVVGWAMEGDGAGWIMFGTALLCVALVPVILFGPPRRRALVFEPEGLRLVEPSWEVLVPWDAIAGARLVDVHDTLVAAFTLRGVDSLAPLPRARGEDPRASMRRLARTVRLNRRFYGCDLSAVPAAHGLDTVLFMRAVETYVSERDARAGLARRAEIEAPR